VESKIGRAVATAADLADQVNLRDGLADELCKS